MSIDRPLALWGGDFVLACQCYEDTSLAGASRQWTAFYPISLGFFIVQPFSQRSSIRTVHSLVAGVRHLLQSWRGRGQCVTVAANRHCGAGWSGGFVEDR